MPYIEARDGTEIYVKDWGQEGGRPVILIHGWPLSADSWDEVAFDLADAGYRVISYDRRGFGRSDQPWEGYDYDTLADDLADVLESAEIEAARLWSAFPWAAARWRDTCPGMAARRDPGRLIGSVVPYLLKTENNPNGADASVFEGIKAGIRKDRPDFFRGFFKDFFGVGVISHPVSNAVLDWAWRLSMQAGLKGTLACVDASARRTSGPICPASPCRP
jgi:hypothetical protein